MTNDATENMCQIDLAQDTAPTRQHEPDHTDHTDHTDQASISALKDLHQVGTDHLSRNRGCSSKGVVT